MNILLPFLLLFFLLSPSSQTIISSSRSFVPFSLFIPHALSFSSTPYSNGKTKSMSTGTSCLLSTTLFVLLFAGMQVYRWQIASTQLMTVFGGFLGSFLFMFALTAIGNLETYFFGKGFHTKLFPEVLISMLVAIFACGLIHRVCITTCIIFSAVTLYYMNKISVKVHGLAAPPTMVNPVPEKRRRK